MEVNNSPTPVPSPLSPIDQTHQDLVAKSANPEMFASLSILLQLVLLGSAFVCGHILRRRKIYWMHEAGSALLMGVVVGLLSRIFNTEEAFRRWLNFSNEFFLLFLLPPIIFESGFSLQVKSFFENFGAIALFAFVGTFIAAIVTGVIMYVVGFLWLSYQLPFVECLIFGALISATDPVTVLAIFQELGGDVNLYALVFGESILNDAVAIVLYRTLVSVVANPEQHRNIYDPAVVFLTILMGSLAIGTVVALACALLFKYAGLAVNNLHNLESCLVILFPYCAYMMADGLSLSGIVAILFNGVLMKHYALPNLSDKAQENVTQFFRLIATLAETFVFIYMGVAIFNTEQSWTHVSFTFFAIIAILAARAANVFPLSYIINTIRPRSKNIPMAHQKALWFSGLRGAMAFALALQSIEDLPTGHGKVMFTTTTAIVVLTVLGVGGSTAEVLRRLDLLGDDFQPLAGEALDGAGEEAGLMRSGNGESDYTPPSSPTSRGSLQMRLKNFQRAAKQYMPEANGTFLETVDKKYIRPFFTTASEEDLTRVESQANGQGPQAEVGEVSSPPEVTSRPPRRLASREGMPGFNPRQKDELPPVRPPT
ncbi:Na+/H+ antiporter [Klebsormidium nitens]|uniref:Sodium/hydrogen exchanger n=1 Tax=Klebsormidium nitens TaxID=105231 RepID=A0A1Y1I7C1_KLENI|nr:Na+/H+ antiporter [Klebsormidium nitens]|eukprot:GAQ86855.1 Na+/H+ antiporter [Klebsormidium nitens]